MWLTPEETRLFGMVGKGIRLMDFVDGSGFDEFRTWDLVRALKSKGAIVPMREVQAPQNFVDALNEPDVDLDVARRQDILSMEKLIESVNHYALLGLTPAATMDQVKKAVMEKGSWYHPDKYFGNRLGSYRARIEKIFRHLRVVQAVLLDPEQRRAYNQQLGIKQEARPTSGRSALRNRERQARLARHPYLRAVHKKAVEIAHGLQVEQGVVRRDAAGRKTTSFQHMQSEAEKAERVAMLEAEVRRAAEYEALGAWGDAAQSWQNASHSEPTEFFFAAKAVLTGLAAELEPRSLRFWAQRAVDIAGHKAEAHLLMAKVLLAAGNKVMARKSLERALELEPDNEEALQLLKKKKGLFG